MVVAAPQKTESVIAWRIGLPVEVPPVLAVGAFLKNTVCVAAGQSAFLSIDIGNLDNAETVLAFEDTVARLLDETGVAPVAVAHDLHPDFASTRYAETLGLRTIPVQHHHAHIAAVMAEHGLGGPTLGLALDGFGLGPGNQSWGGELLRADVNGGYARLGHLAPLLQPGGDAAAQQPWRMGAAALHALGRGDEIAARYAEMPGAAVVARMLERGVNCPRTSSAGRLFDAICGLVGLRLMADFEGQGPMELERLVNDPQIQGDGWRIEDGVLDLKPVLAVLADLDAPRAADLFHGTLIAALADWVGRTADAMGLVEVVFSGGCFLNAVLRRGVASALEAKGLTPRLPEALTPGDPAVSLGQAWVAAQTLIGESGRS